MDWTNTIAFITAIIVIAILIVAMKKATWSNPLEREQDRIANQIIRNLDNLSCEAKDEIIRLVISEVYNGQFHIHQNPSCKRA
ncbi:MAG: hypothetical protein WC332_00700 [Clostridia bacterium]|jgi:hypothetical protein